MYLASQMVVDFHEKFKIQYDGPPRDLPPKLRQFREMRLMEEAREFAEAGSVGDREMQLDANIDVIYIALGNLHLMGIRPEQVAEAFERVHDANMRKELCHDGNPSKYAHLGQNVDIVKPPNWAPPDLYDLAYSNPMEAGLV